MSQNEKKLVEEITNLPAQMQDKLLLLAQGAALALETLREADADTQGKADGGKNDGGAA